jgi:lipoate-protein ligase A
MRIWRLLKTGALPGALNMAIDEALLQGHALGLSPPTLRFYQWQPPAVSIGYFQQPEDINLSLCRALGFDAVRRPTGGRAVLHQNDLTYSLVAGTGEGMPSSLPEAYHLICRGLLAGLRLLGIEAKMGREKPIGPPPELCFLQTSVGDILCQGKKILGNAQMWKGSSLLQHGSLLLEDQKETWANLLGIFPELKGPFTAELASRITSLREQSGFSVEIDRVRTALKEGLSQILEVTFETGRLSSEEWEMARKIDRDSQKSGENPS